MKRYQHIYFDLDRTLWDFESNSISAFKDIFEMYDLDKTFGDFNIFYQTYRKHNERLWMAYRDGKIRKSLLRFKRFSLTLEEYGIKDDELGKKIGDDYIRISPTKTQLFPHAYEVLDYLKGKYRLYIITNGFNEVQFTKLRNCDLEKYFDKVFTSEDAGANKPKPLIFQHALKNVNASKKDSIMIGDDYDVDIIGAKRFGIDQIWFNTNGKSAEEEITHEIKSLKEILSIL